MFASHLSESQVVTVLDASDVWAHLGLSASGNLDVETISQRKGTYRVDTLAGEFIVRFAHDEAHLMVLRREERIQRGLAGRIALRLPDTRVVEGTDAHPAFAIHRMIPGEPLTTELVSSMSPAAYARLVGDLVVFFRQIHATSLEEACGWLCIPYEGAGAVARLAATQGKPGWFDSDTVSAIRSGIATAIDAWEQDVFEDTVRRFDCLDTDAAYMVFGHGDIHGYNVAMGKDGLGPKITGVFDLGCAGILDVHEDVFRLSLVSEDLLDRVLEAYQGGANWQVRLDRERIAVYYCAFLFYLMAETSGEAREHLRRLLRMHVDIS